MQSGGFLHIDDNYGMDQYLRKELVKIFPNKELVELPYNHPIFNEPSSRLVLISLPQIEVLFLSISGSNWTAPICLSSCIHRILAKLTHPFSASVYCQRFKILSCFANGTSKNESPFWSFFWVLWLPCIKSPELHLLFTLKFPCALTSWRPFAEVKKLKNKGNFKNLSKADFEAPIGYDPSIYSCEGDNSGENLPNFGI